MDPSRPIGCGPACWRALATLPLLCAGSAVFALSAQPAQAQVLPAMIEVEIDARPRLGARRIERLWTNGHVSMPYAAFSDENLRPGVHITKRWIAANFPYLSHVLVSNFLLGNTATLPSWAVQAGLRIEEIWTRAGGFNPYWDRYIANITDAGAYPLVSLTGTPRDMVQGPISDWPWAFFHHVIEPPSAANLSAWGDLIETMYRRSQAQGREPSRWKWAMWVEPDLRGRFTGTMSEFGLLAAQARAALDRAAGSGPRPELRFGNFLSPSPTSYPYVPFPSDIQSGADRFLLQTNLTGVLDGAALSLFEVEPKDQSLRYIEGSLDRLREICRQAGVPNYPIHVDEMGMLYYLHPISGIPGGGTRWIEALKGEPAMNCASWHAMLLHSFLDREVTSCAPFFLDHYWRGVNGSATSNANYWLKLAAYNAFDMFEELVGLERVPLDIDHPRLHRSVRNGVEANGRVAGVVGRDDRHVTALLYSHGGVDLREEVTLNLDFRGLLGNTRYFAEIYRIDQNRGSVYDRLLREWIERAQRHPVPFRYPNGIWSWDLSQNRRFDFYWQDPNNYTIFGWCLPLGPLEPVLGRTEFFAAGLNQLLSYDRIATYQKIDDYYLADSQHLVTAADGSGAGLALSLPMHNLALVRLTAIEEEIETGSLHLSFEKDLESAEGILPSEAHALSFDRGVETPLAWQGSHRHPGIDWTTHETKRHPRGIYPPRDPWHPATGNGSEAFRGVRCSTVDGQSTRLAYAQHPINPVRGSIDLWFKPENAPSFVGDDLGSSPGPRNELVLLHCIDEPGVDELLITVSGGQELVMLWILDGVTVANVRAPVIELGRWNHTWHRLTAQWSYDLGPSREFRAQMIVDGQTVLSSRRSHRNSRITAPFTLSGPLLIGRHAYDASFRPWDGVIDELRIAAVSNAFHP
ncbi:MAG: hypothetical protein IPN34_13975 [Planctomycetes bacterium]|nr:hypothetical protein [Planctomycetota bacterium]